MAGKSRTSSKEDLAAALTVIEDVAQSKPGRPFAHAVSSEDAPDYSTWIKHPMHLGLISRRLRGGHYLSTSAH